MKCPHCGEDLPKSKRGRPQALSEMEQHYVAEAVELGERIPTIAAEMHVAGNTIRKALRHVRSLKRHATTS
jgi:DNA-binding NarL/FixJ family response regulator